MELTLYRFLSGVIFNHFSSKMTAMINGVSFPVFFIFMCGLLKSYGNKTSITIGNLVTRDTEGPTKKGFELALDVANNSSEFNEFFGKYDIQLFTLNTHVRLSFSIASRLD